MREPSVFLPTHLAYKSNVISFLERNVIIRTRIAIMCTSFVHNHIAVVGSVFCIFTPMQLLVIITIIIISTFIHELRLIFCRNYDKQIGHRRNLTFINKHFRLNFIIIQVSVPKALNIYDV